MAWESRIVGHGKVRVEDVIFNPDNWRIHPSEQQDVLGAALHEVGFVRSVTVNQRTGHLVDGHLRLELAQETGEQELDVELVSLSPGEEAEILALLDPIAALAATDRQQYANLLKDLQAENDAVRDFLARAASSEHIWLAAEKAGEHEGGAAGGPSMRIMQLLYAPAEYARVDEALIALEQHYDLGRAAALCKAAEVVWNG